MYWWLGMKCEISKFVSRCLICQQVKAEHQVASGLLQPVTIPKWKWERVTMDFVSGLPVTPRKKDSIWVIVDRLTKSAHFIPVRVDYSLEKLAELYVSKIVRLHGVPSSIISDRNSRFTSRFWNKLYEAFIQRIIRRQMGRQSNIKMAPFEALYGIKCRTPLFWTELSESKLVGIDLIREATDKVQVIQDCLKAASDCQTLYADLERKDIKFVVRDRVLCFGKTGKLIPRFIGPYKIIERASHVAYKLVLPLELEKIHNVFHVLMLKRYRSDPSHIISPYKVESQHDLSYFEESIKILAREIKELRNKRVSLVKFLWNHHRVEEAT
ncbi:DNA/RNA polymerases superfamily protein [Gossypium australe]|uniref:DNA/RNA polymerases superfamily protein n=1 Tax=Gossypium australe TaxID=47621 RepID=A0A5B6VQ84_9ROSI|nr:DNA/RNA polymerases superfamily protein [Gossypium australe]